MLSYTFSSNNIKSLFDNLTFKILPPSTKTNLKPIKALEDPGTNWNNGISRPKTIDENPMFKQVKDISFEHYPDYSKAETCSAEALKPMPRRPVEKYQDKIVYVNPSVLAEKLKRGKKGSAGDSNL